MNRGYLLDTNALIWAADNSDRLPPTHKDIIATGEGLFVSIVSVWEIAIKQSLGKLTINGDIADAVRRSGIPLLPVELAHIDALRALPWHHRDPFDRMLIAQAMVENLVMITSDRHFQAYGIDLL